MTDLTRRQALTVAAVAGTTLAAGGARADEPNKPRAKLNREPPRESTATAESYGPRELFAAVDADGTLQRSFHALTSVYLGQGVYEVIFKRDVRRGAYLATTGGPGYAGVPVAAVANVMGRATDPRGVLVYIANMQGDPIAAGFHLLVVCPDGYA